MAVVRVGALPDGALQAAAEFYAKVMPNLLALPAEDHVLIFGPADHSHRAWRLAVVQQLALDHAPGRVNAIESDDEVAIAAALAYAEIAPGLTGQLLKLDGIGADALLSALQ